MYDLLLIAVRDILVQAGIFASVQCGVGAPMSYPAASLWLHKSVDKDGKRDAVEAETIIVQVQGYADEDTEQSYLALMAIVHQAKAALHHAKLPGLGSRGMVVESIAPGMMEHNGPTVYLLMVSVLVTPSTFTTS